MQLHYQTQGQGQPLILLHGLFGSSDNWGIIAKHFAQQFQVISVDLRNHGKSHHSTTQSYPEMADDLNVLCDYLGLQGIHLLGHSLGGKVAMQFAAQNPQRINKLIVVDMALRAYADAHTHLIDAMLALDLSQIQTRSQADKMLANSISNTMVRQFLLMNLVRSEPQMQWRINLQALKDNYPNLQSAIQFSHPYTQPYMFIHGEHSDYVNASDIAEIKKNFTQAKFASLPTGHWVHAEQPQMFIELVESFISA